MYGVINIVIFYTFVFVIDYLFLFNDTAANEIYTLSLHDALPIYSCVARRISSCDAAATRSVQSRNTRSSVSFRSEEHTSELQSHSDLVCRLLLEKKNTTDHTGLHHLSYLQVNYPNVGVLHSLHCL